MDEDFLDELPENEKLKIENEIKKLKIEMAGGKIITGPNNLNLPPEIESIFLDNILEFENKLKNKKEITIREMLNFPELKEENEMDDFELEVELEEFMTNLNEKSIRLSTLYDVEDRELYLFIKNEFLDKKTLDFGIPGMMCQFIYEEFHPNHKEMIRELCEDFIHNFCNKTGEDSFSYFENQPEIHSKFNLFREAYEQIDIEQLELVTMTISKRSAKAIFNLTIKCKIEGTREFHIFSGKARFSLSVKDIKNWNIKTATIPFKGLR